MRYVTGLKCTVCSTVYSPDEAEYVCPADSGNLDVLYDYAQIRLYMVEHGLSNDNGMWRYRVALPLPYDASTPPLTVGATPLYLSGTAANAVGLESLYIKDDGRNPTASLKDRASALIVAKAHAEGRKVITTASTGNAAAALAGMAASMGMTTVIFVPASAPVAKITQLMVYGAHVLLVDGSYDQAFDLCLEATEQYGWYCRNTGFNPFTQEGKKTVSYEIAEQMSGKEGEFVAPDSLFVSVGDGNIISGVHKGFKELLSMGMIQEMPRIFGIQAAGSAALYHAWREGIDPVALSPISASTIADSISAGLPRDPVKAMKAVSETDGQFIAVTDDAILEAIPMLARTSGVFAEPAAAAAYAGIRKAAEEGLIARDEHAVLLVTGNGLKDIAAVQEHMPRPQQISPSIQAVAEAVDKIFGL